MADFADDTSTTAERQARALKVMALVETASYLVLAYCWLVADNRVAVRIVGFFHGFIWLAFCAMVVIIRPAIRWSWPYVALVVLTGPIGGVLVWERIRREGVPEQYPSPSP